MHRCNKFSLGFKTMILYAFLISPTRAICPIHPDISGEQQKLQQHNAVQCPTYIFFFFFLLWLYNSLCRVLAFSTNSFHLLLSWTRVFQFGTFSFCISFLASSSQRVFGLPIGLFEMDPTYITLIFNHLSLKTPEHC